MELSMRQSAVRGLSVVVSVALVGCATAQRGEAPFSVEEATISGIHAALRAGSTSCRDIVSQYLGRIERLDRQGPAINALVVVNPDALRIAGELDERRARGGA